MFFIKLSVFICRFCKLFLLTKSLLAIVSYVFSFAKLRESVIFTKCFAKMLTLESRQTLAFQKSWFYLRQLKPIKNDEKYFLFHRKNSFCS